MLQNNKENNKYNLIESVKLRAELDYWEQKMGLKKAPLFARLLRKYRVFKSKYLYKNIKEKVDKKVYLKYCRLGFLGLHQFYSGNILRGILYLLLLPTGVTFALALIDYLEAKLIQDKAGVIILPKNYKILQNKKDVNKLYTDEYVFDD